jgi:hypothetical protein
MIIFLDNDNKGFLLESFLSLVLLNKEVAHLDLYEDDVEMAAIHRPCILNNAESLTIHPYIITWFSSCCDCD